MDLILWSALAVAQTLYPIKIIAFVVMGNHVHLIALVEDPEVIESFMERFKCETGHAINRLLGRRQVTVWCEGYDSPAILTVDDLVEKLAYVYANPVRANQTASIATYRGVSSWRMFASGELSKEVKRIRRPFVEQLPNGRLSDSQQKRLASLAEQQATEILEFTLSPNAWTTAFPGSLSPAKLVQKVHQRLQEIEAEMAEERRLKRITLPTFQELFSQPIDTPYAPKKFTPRMWCICGDIPLRVAFIQFIKRLRAKGRQVRLKWLSGDLSEPFPLGLFPPCQPMLATLLPAFVRRRIVPA
jgi:REP element-mobilizing transposase RayT